MAYLKFLAVIALVASIAWFVVHPGFHPALSALGSLSALVSAFLVEKRNARRARQIQSVSQSSVGVQAGGDVSIGNVGIDKNAK